MEKKFKLTLRKNVSQNFTGTTTNLKQNSNLKGVTAIDLRAGFAGVFGLFSAVVVAAKDFRATGVFGFPSLTAVPEKMGLKILGDFNLSFFPFVAADVAMVTLVCLFPGWKNGFATGEPNTKVSDLLRLVMEGLKETSACLP